MKHLFTGLACLAASLPALAQPDCAQIIQASFTLSQQDNVVIVTNSSATMFPQATTYQWYFGDGETANGPVVTHIYDGPGNYVICLVAVVENCVDSACQEIEVIGGPSPCDDLSAEFTMEIQGSEVAFENSVSSNLFSYQWFFGDGSVGYGQNPEHTYPEPGTYAACLVVWAWDPLTQDTCFDENCEIVVIQEEAQPCDGLEAGFVANTFPLGAQFSNTTTGTGFQTTWHWSFGDGAMSNNPQPAHTYDEAGWYVVCLSAVSVYELDSGGVITCMDSVCQEVFIPGDASPCDSLSAFFTVTTQGDLAAFTTFGGNNIGYLWHFGDGAVSDNPSPTHVYPGPGTYNACLTTWSWDPGTQDTCYADHCEWVTIAGEPCDSTFACFQWGIQNNTAQFYNCSYTIGEPHYWWSFGDGTNSDDYQPSHTYPGPGVYTVCLTVWTNDSLGTCSDTLCNTLVIQGEPSPCDSLSAYFVVTTQENLAAFTTFGGTAIGYHWIFGDGTEGTGPAPTHIYPGDGTYHACLVTWTWDPQTQDSCYAEHCEWITIGSSVPCDSLFACFQWGVQENTVQYYNCSWPGNQDLDYWWTFGDGTSSDAYQPTHTYPGPGTYIVCLTAYLTNTPDSCSNTICHTVVIQGEPSPCDSLSADFVVTTQDSLATFTSSGGTAIGYHWYFGDGTQGDGSSTTHIYPGPGTYNACLVTWTWDPQTQDTCYAEHCEPVVIEETGPCAELVAGFTPLVGDVTVWFSNTTTGTGFATTWHWDFGDGTTSSDAQPSHVFPELGTYEVCLTVMSIYEQPGGEVVACQDTYCNMVYTGGPSPCDSLSAYFEVFGIETQAVFTSYGGTAMGYHWTFGDGAVSGEPNPVHVYPGPGTYHACLLTWTWDPQTQDTCYADHCEWITIGNGNPCDSLYACFQWGGEDDVLQFYNCSSSNSGDLYYQWSFGDGTYSDAYEPLHTFPGPGTYTVCLTVTVMNSPDSCADTICNTVIVEGGSPCDGFTASFEWSDLFNGAVHFYGFANPPANGYQWFFGDGTQGDGMNPIHEYAEPGMYQVCLSAWHWNQQTQDTCWAEYCEWIQVAGEDNPCDSIAAHFVWEPAGPNAFLFQDASETNGQDVSYWWSFGDGSYADGPNPDHAYQEPGQYQVCLTITVLNSPDSCTSTTCQVLNVQGGGSPCDGLNAEFSASVSGFTIALQAGMNPPGSTYEWLFGNGSTADGASTTYTYDEPGTYNVCLIVGNYDPFTQDSCFEDHCQQITITGGGMPCDSLWEVHFEYGHQGNVYSFYNTSDTQGNLVSTHWDFGDGSTGDGSQTNHTYTEGGEYTVCMTITGIIPGTDDTCQTTVCQQIEVILGIHDVAGAASLNAWPQPFDDVLQLESADLQGLTRLTLLDMTGRVVDDRSVNAMGRIAVHYDQLSTGAYVLRLLNDTMDRSIRVVKR